MHVRVADKGIGRLAEETEAAIYFCAREAIQNSAKHAGDGATVTVTLAPIEDSVELVVSDDGVGMRTDRATDGMGIIDMRDRVEAVGGHFDIVSAPGLGTSIRATIPAGQGRRRGPMRVTGDGAGSAVAP